MIAKLRKLFESGRYADVIAASSSKNKLNIKYTLGAHVFLGKYTESEQIYLNHNWKSTEFIEASFYQLLSYIRQGKVETAKKLIVKMFNFYLSERIQKFYILQSLGIFNFYQGKIEKAYSLSEQAFKVSLRNQQNYQSLISSDLRGHSACLLGDYGRGIKYFQTAKLYANKVNNNLNIQNIDLSIISFSIESGNNLKQTFNALKKFSKNFETQDSLSQINVELLFVKYYLLVGNLPKAEKILNSVGQRVQATESKRQILGFSILFSELFFAKQEFSSCLQNIYHSLEYSDNKGDQLAYLKLKRLELKTKHKLSLPIDLNLQKENRLDSTSPSREDFVETNREELKSDGLTAKVLKKLSEENMLGLIYQEHIYNNLDFIDTSFGKDNILISLNGEIKILKNLTLGQINFLEILSQKQTWSKEKLFYEFWGGRYDPFIHDNKIYITISRINKKLDFTSKLIRIEGSKIYFPKIVFLSKKSNNQLQISEGLGLEQLNYRQRHFLNISRSQDIVLPRKYSRSYQVSRNTTSRDLRELVERGFIKSHGSRKSTYYTVI